MFDGLWREAEILNSTASAELVDLFCTKVKFKSMFYHYVVLTSSARCLGGRDRDRADFLLLMLMH